MQQKTAAARNARKKRPPNEMNTMTITVGILLSGDGEGGGGRT